jgi:GT2 family glycosyltransferase
MAESSNCTRSAEGPLVSVVIPTFGRPERVSALIELLQAQEIPVFRVEIIVVDDGSPEPIGPSLAARFPAPAIPLRCLRKENSGPGIARNYGVEHSHGDIIIFLDDDMWISRDFLKTHVEVQSAFKPCVVYSEFEYRVEGSLESFRQWYEGKAAEWIRARRAAMTLVSGSVFSVPSPMVTSANLSVRREDFKAVGGFDTSYQHASCEDQDFGIRLGLRGVRALVSTASKVVHIEMHNTLPKVCRRQFLGAKETVRFVRRLGIEEGPEQPAIAASCGWIVLGRDSFGLVSKKLAKQIVASRLLKPLVFGSVKLLEKVAPCSRLLRRTYDLVLGSYIQAGWREGLRVD